LSKMLDNLEVPSKNAGLLQLKVSGTSSLLPGNPAWEMLKEACNVSYAGFSEWSSFLFKSPPKDTVPEISLFVVFFQDVFATDTVADLESTGCTNAQLEELLSPILSGIDHFLRQHSSDRVIVAWSNDAPASAIPYARQEPIWQRMEKRWELALRERQNIFKSLCLLPMDRFFANIGVNHCFDARNYYTARCRLSQRGLAELTKQIGILVERLSNPSKKVLVLDCDNTLWGGVVAEDGLAGIQLGQDGVGTAYTDFQQVIRGLAKRGILLALVSKNNEADVWQVFDQHPSMILRRDDIVASRINWKNKSENLIELADELGLGLDSVVFWDDNPLERESMKAQLPQITVPNLPKDIWDWSRWLQSSPLFTNFEFTSEDASRKQLYAARAKFAQSGGAASSETDFLKSIALQASIVPIHDATISRAAQLTNKTNQFNLRSARYDVAALQQIIIDKNVVSFLAKLKDKFGDHGNIGLVIAHCRKSSRVAALDTFLLSCRVLGRHLEAWLLQECIRELQARQIEFLLAEYIPNGRNEMVLRFLREHGFTALKDCDMALQEQFGKAIQNSTGEIFLAKISEMSIPYLEIFAA
jgi:FkbH-like protein